MRAHLLGRVTHSSGHEDVVVKQDLGVGTAEAQDRRSNEWIHLWPAL
jgi:hypothetical protein